MGAKTIIDFFVEAAIRKGAPEKLRMPQNCIEVSGYWVCQDGDLYHLYDPIQKCWFGFDIPRLERAKTICLGLAGN